ncbi:metal-dependent hydrolase [Thermorudis peleae]|uniref:metal-dependent hydrolase n=1 Tax=Thermorudis peleae TaxID=1382356 RepID=UPI000690DF4E|nr:metal-dependent hydrolase [Thermorudis peleae]MBX6752831.1 metal-dependent hydrolase [Thermorudis peleae]
MDQWRRNATRARQEANWHTVALVAVASGIAAACHWVWQRAPDPSPQRALADGCCHAATAFATALPAAYRVPDPSRFLVAAVLGGVAIDLDHVAAARSLRLTDCMTMPSRPPTHSLATILLASSVVALIRPWRGLGLGAFLGLSSHLLRDVSTGGAPLFRRDTVWRLPYPLALLVNGMVGILGWWLAGTAPKASMLSTITTRQIYQHATSSAAG